MPDTATEFTIREVAVDVVRPLRKTHLRPNRPASAVVYRTDEDETARHFAAFDAEDRVLGVASLHFEDRVAGQPPFGHPGMRIRGVAVEDDWRGRGVGAALVEHMLGIGREADIVEAWANARAENLGFYARAGFREVSSEFEITGIGRHRVVARSLVEKPRKVRRMRKRAEPSDGATSGRRPSSPGAEAEGSSAGAQP